MKKTLQSLGMARAFTDAAEFDGLCENGKANLFISQVAHKAFVEVTEKGTEAAAATAAIAMAAAMPLTRPFTPTVRADHPFLFAIRDVQTGTILFLGRLTNPVERTGK
jgi:serpin B